MPKKQSQKHTKKNQSRGWLISNIIYRVLQALVILVVVLILLGGALGIGIGAGYFAFLVEDTHIPTKDTVQEELGNITQTSKLVYSDDSEISTIHSDLLRTAIPSDQMSDKLKTAIISTEDEYFKQHHGFVPKAVIRALVSEATGIGSSGGSTLTQQLVKQQMLTDEPTFKRKANEILLASQVEKHLSKDQIITTYLNVSPFGRNNRGQNIAGVEEAAKGIFGVSAKDVNLPQAAFIAGLPQSPITYSPYLNTGQLKSDDDLKMGLARKDFVLFSMYRENAISKKEYDEAKAYDLKKDFQPQQQAQQEDHGFLYYTILNEATEVLVKQMADHDKADLSDKKIYQAYYDRASQTLSDKGYTVHSTIDKSIYNAMQSGAAEFGSLLADNSGVQVETGNVLMDNATGKVYGFVGGLNYGQSQLNHAFDSYRQAGSSIKPMLVYGPAIDMGIMGSESRVSDYPAKWSGGTNEGEDIVNATNKGSNTFQTIRESLVWSNNIPATHIYQDVLSRGKSPQYAYENYLKKMNYPSNDVWGYESAPLGTVDVSTVQQVNGFQTLANHGTYEKGYVVESITDNSGNTIYKHESKPVQVYSKATASIMNDMMRSVINEKITTPFKDEITGLNSTLGQADWIGKTGSTNEYKDSWLVVSTPSVTMGSWAGHDQNQPMDNMAGHRSAKYLANLINRVHEANPQIFGTDKKFELDPSVKKEKVSEFTGTKPGKAEVNGRTIQTPGKETESLWAKDGPPDTTFKFGIGGSDANYSNYWSKSGTSTSSKRN